MFLLLKHKLFIRYSFYAHSTLEMTMVQLPINNVQLNYCLVVSGGFIIYSQKTIISLATFIRLLYSTLSMGFDLYV